MAEPSWDRLEHPILEAVAEPEHQDSSLEAALHAIPRVKDNGEPVRPEARILDGVRATLFDHLLAPPNPGVAPASLHLFA